ncbi:MAG: hypothetical protein AB7I27_11260 [Bacteriovoracaceae bacterium]
MKKIVLIGFIFLNSARAEIIPVLKSNPNNCLVELTENYQLKIKCQGSIKTSKNYDLTPGPNFEQEFNFALTDIDYLSIDKDSDKKSFKDSIKSIIEKRLTISLPTNEEIMKRGLKNLDSALQIIAQDKINCEPNKELVKPIIELSLNESSQEEIVQLMADEKMKQEGFINLGKFKSFSIKLNTENDNFLHGGGQVIFQKKWKDHHLPSWEGDDRGYTFGEDLNLDLNFTDGSINFKQYSKGYSVLAPQKGSISICIEDICDNYDYDIYFDEKGKLYQHFLSVDGLLIEVKKNLVNNQYYIKVGGSIEKLTDKKNGISHLIQTEWHKMGTDYNQIEYNSIHLLPDERRYNASVAVGLERSQTPLSWFGIKEMIEGKIQLSSAEKSNSYVEFNASVELNSGSLLRKSSKEPPIIEAKLSASNQTYKTRENYSQIGIRIRGNIITNRSGNIIGIYTGVQKYTDPFAEKFGVYEKSTKGKYDLNYIYGITFETPL